MSDLVDKKYDHRVLEALIAYDIANEEMISVFQQDPSIILAKVEIANSAANLIADLMHLSEDIGIKSQSLIKDARERYAAYQRAYREGEAEARAGFLKQK